ncbi:hypothetical protein DB29_03631 [Shouchella clausii]|nr:hypothetical protein DB29_03631 [Shouchella clausii]
MQTLLICVLQERLRIKNAYPAKLLLTIALANGKIRTYPIKSDEQEE